MQKVLPPMKWAAFVLLLFTTIVFAKAQVPQAINYQAIARDAGGSPYANRNISVRFTINTGINPGFPIYQETQTAVTNQFGLFTTKIGYGNPTIGSFPAISWAGGNKYLLVEYDPNGGTNYLNMGSSELVSVPYALYAETAGTAAGTGPTGPTGPAGAAGAAGAAGPTGPAGAAGATGPSVTSIVVNPNGTLTFTYTRGATITTTGNPVIGPTGATGATGSQGLQGATGAQGLPGATGAQGIAGPAGATGVQGATGATGPTGSGGGATGPTGATGP